MKNLINKKLTDKDEIRSAWVLIVPYHLINDFIPFRGSGSVLVQVR